MPRTPIRKLRVDCIDLKPYDYDWSEHPHDVDGYNDGMHGWQCWEVITCEECGHDVVVAGLHHGIEHRDLIDHDDYDDEDTGKNPRYCAGRIYTEGPQMNYLLPVDHSAWMHAGEGPGVAEKIAHLPLCAVETEDEFGFALTGGGMDMSWYIVEAYVAIGCLPPTHYCDLPVMAGRGTSRYDRYLIGACMESLRSHRRWLNYRMMNLRRLRNPERGR